MTKKFNITNGTTAEIDFNQFTGDYVMHHFVRNSIRSMGRYASMEDAIDRLHKLANMWGGFEVEEA